MRKLILFTIASILGTVFVSACPTGTGPPTVQQTVCDSLKHKGFTLNDSGVVLKGQKVKGGDSVATSSGYLLIGPSFDSAATKKYVRAYVSDSSTTLQQAADSLFDTLFANHNAPNQRGVACYSATDGGSPFGVVCPVSGDGDSVAFSDNANIHANILSSANGVTSSPSHTITSGFVGTISCQSSLAGDTAGFLGRDITFSSAADAIQAGYPNVGTWLAGRGGGSAPATVPILYWKSSTVAVAGTGPYFGWSGGTIDSVMFPTFVSKTSQGHANFTIAPNGAIYMGNLGPSLVTATSDPLPNVQIVGGKTYFGKRNTIPLDQAFDFGSSQPYLNGWDIEYPTDVVGFSVQPAIRKTAGGSNFWLSLMSGRVGFTENTLRANSAAVVKIEQILRTNGHIDTSYGLHIDPAIEGELQNITLRADGNTWLQQLRVDTLTAYSDTVVAKNVLNVRGQSSDGGTLTLGENKAFQGSVSYTGAGATVMSINNSYDAAGSRIDFNLRTSGTPVQAMRIFGDGEVQIPQLVTGCVTSVSGLLTHSGCSTVADSIQGVANHTMVYPSAGKTAVDLDTVNGIKIPNLKIHTTGNHGYAYMDTLSVGQTTGGGAFIGNNGAAMFAEGGVTISSAGKVVSNDTIAAVKMRAPIFQGGRFVGDSANFGSSGFIFSPASGSASVSGSFLGDVPVTDLNGGALASSSTFWRGDGVWRPITQDSNYISMTLGTLNMTNTARGAIHWRNNDSLYWDSASLFLKTNNNFQAENINGNSSITVGSNAIQLGSNGNGIFNGIGSFGTSLTSPIFETDSINVNAGNATINNDGDIFSSGSINLSQFSGHGDKIVGVHNNGTFYYTDTLGAGTTLQGVADSLWDNNLFSSLVPNENRVSTYQPNVGGKPKLVTTVLDGTAGTDTISTLASLSARVKIASGIVQGVGQTNSVTFADVTDSHIASALVIGGDVDGRLSAASLVGSGSSVVTANSVTGTGSVAVLATGPTISNPIVTGTAGFVLATPSALISTDGIELASNATSGLGIFGFAANTPFKMGRAGGTFASPTVTTNGLSLLNMQNCIDTASGTGKWVCNGVLSTAMMGVASPTNKGTALNVVLIDSASTTANTVLRVANRRWNFNGATDVPGTQFHFNGNMKIDSALVVVGGCTGCGLSNGTFTATLTGVSATVTQLCSYSLNGNQVTITIPQDVTGTSNSTGMTFTGLPAALQPVTPNQVFGYAYTTATTEVPATALFTNSGTVTFSAMTSFGALFSSSAWAATVVTKGIPAQTFTYNLN